MIKKIFIVFILSFTGLFAAEKTRIAVVSLEAKNGVDAQLAATITDLINTELVSLRRFDVVDRDNMEAVLQEQAMQNSGCTDSACAVQIGNLLNVEKMVVGSVSKLGEQYLITVNFIDVELSQVTLSERITSPDESQLLDAVSQLAIKIGNSVNLNGRIIRMEDGEILVNIGASDGVERGQRVKVVRYGDPIIDEETGELLGRDVDELGFATIKDFNGERLSVIAPERGAGDMQKGDRVIVLKADVPEATASSAGERSSDRERSSVNRNPIRSGLMWTGVLGMLGGGGYYGYNVSAVQQEVDEYYDTYLEYKPEPGLSTEENQQQVNDLYSTYETAKADKEDQEYLGVMIAGGGAALFTIALFLPRERASAFTPILSSDSIAFYYQGAF